MTTEPAAQPRQGVQGRSEAPLPDAAPIVPELQRAAESDRLTEEIAAAYDPVGIGTFFDQVRPGKRRSVKLADGTVITGG